MQLVRSVVGGMLAATLACAGGDDSSGSATSTGPTGDTPGTGDVSGSSTGGGVPTTGDEPATSEPATTAPTTTGGPGTSTDPTTDEPATGTGPEGSSSSGGAHGSACASATLTLCTDFEDGQDGMFPPSWGARGDEWGEGVIGVASDDARLGMKSLKADGGNNGQHFMDYKGDLGALATHHYGRVFMKVAVPAPWPADGVLHADFIEGLGPGPGGSTHNVRWGVVENTSMKMQWIYNVQPSNGDPEFGEGTGYEYAWTGEWQCIEWFYDQPSQMGSVWIDDVQLPIVPGTNHAAEIPVFSSLGVGLANYQPAGAGYTVWFDELAYHDQRIGCDLGE